MLKGSTRRTKLQPILLWGPRRKTEGPSRGHRARDVCPGRYTPGVGMEKPHEPAADPVFAKAAVVVSRSGGSRLGDSDSLRLKTDTVLDYANRGTAHREIEQMVSLLLAINTPLLQNTLAFCYKNNTGHLKISQKTQNSRRHYCPVFSRESGPHFNIIQHYFKCVYMSWPIWLSG